MTIHDLESYVWDRLPKLQRTLAGRYIAGRVVRRAVRTWPVPVLEQCNADETEVVGKQLAKNIERNMRHEVGMGIILTLVLSALISEVVKILVRWWLERQENQADMRTLVRESKHHD
jgi:hypothetical protein